MLWTSRKTERSLDHAPRGSRLGETGRASGVGIRDSPRNESRFPNPESLLDFDLCADFLELLLDGRGLFLGDAFLDRLGRALDEVLGFLEAERGDLADDLDDVDLVAAHFGERDGEVRLLFRRSRRAATGRRAAARE